MNPHDRADGNIRSFLFFRIFFNSRFYYPVLTILFLDLGLSLEQYSLLNVAWALSIVCLEVPSGALADVWGRKKLVVIAGCLMVVEMLVFSFAPNDNISLLFALFLVNRILSGAAEACASGADEALVYDSLKEAGREGEWPEVLARLVRWQSVTFFVVLLLGAAVYDPNLVNGIGRYLGHDWHVRADQLVRVPLYLTLLFSLVACAAAFSLFEQRTPAQTRVRVSAAFREIAHAARWIVASRVALFVLGAALCNDAFIRLVMTMTSEYFRVLNLPEALFGIIASVTALLGFLSPWAAKKLMALGSPQKAFAVLSFFTLTGLFLLPLTGSAWSLMTVFALSFGMGVVSFLSSTYLNQVAEPSRRATILSFRGLTGNLAYGGLGIVFASLLKRVEGQAATPTTDSKLGEALAGLPWIFAGMIVLVYALSWLRARQRSS